MIISCSKMLIGKFYAVSDAGSPCDASASRYEVTSSAELLFLLNVFVVEHHLGTSPCLLANRLSCGCPVVYSSCEPISVG